MSRSHAPTLVSDQESDLASTMYSFTTYPAPRARTNTDLNLGVLQRYLPSITTILSIAANAVVYTFDSAAQAWEKSGVEGTMFVCAMSARGACVFILNRRGLQNVIVDLAKVTHVEIVEKLVMLRVDEGEKVLGLWIHEDQEDTTVANGPVIEQTWKAARAAGAKKAERRREVAGPAMQAVGRQLSLSELFERLRSETAQ